MIIFPTVGSIKKALDDGYLSREVYDNTYNILMSKNMEDAIFMGQFIKTDLINRLSSNLNDEQRNILSNMLEYIYSPMDENLKACLLNGSAGTGKTTTMAKIIYAVTILSPEDEINVNAPTHKAIKVLEEKCSNINNNGQVTFGTTHSSLGLRATYTNDGKLKFSRASREPSNLRLMICDETSMLEDEIAKIIMDSKNFKNTKIIFMGDIKQLPPVNSKESFIFSNTERLKIYQMNLTKIVRQVADNPIVKYTKFLGDNIDKIKHLKFQQEVTKDGDGIIIRSIDQLDNIIKYWYSLPETIANPDNLRILAWTNRMVNKCNVMCRNLLFNNPKDKFVPGERIVVREQILKSGKSIAENSDELVVKQCKIVKLKKKIPFTKEIVPFDFYEIYTHELKDVLYVITKESRELYEKKLEDVKQFCIRQSDKHKWEEYYNMKRWSSNINYAYANTIHTSQGSTYQNALVIMSDVENNNNFVERNKLCYTAFTRAKKKLIILL